MSEMVPPGTSYQVDSTLGEVLSPGGSNDAWQDFLPDAWWWCSYCYSVFQEKEIGYAVYPSGNWNLFCPHCDAEVDEAYAGPGLYLRDFIFWYHGWPSRVLVGWVPCPVSGQRFALPYEPSRPLPEVKPGKNSHRPHLSRRRRK